MMHVVNFNKWAYRLVEDRQDGLSKVPIFDREAFQAGITFKAKYVGTLEITRPTCRSEIVTAMRKVRYEFKIKAIEKRRIFLTISVDGIKVTLRKRRRRLRKEYLLDDEPVILHEHAIGRIFYVSHDSMDLKIFSYITKDNFDNLFRCSVFKAYKKSRALFVVRTIGQAFEVCHRLQQESAEEKKDAPVKKVVDENVLADEGTDIDDVNLDLKAVEDEQKEKQDKDMLLVGDLRPSVDADNNLSQLTAEQIRLLFNQQVQHYMQEVERYKSESQLLKDQLILERNARVQSQEREKCLLQKNRELLQTIQTLANRLQKVNPGDDGLTAASNSPKQPETLLNPGGPSLFSPPFQYNNVDHSTRYGIGSSPEHQGIAGNSMIIAPPSSVIDTFDPLASKPLPSVTLEDINNYSSTLPKQKWKTFDDEDDVHPGIGHDDSNSESSEEEHFSENFGGFQIHAKERNGWVDLNDNSTNSSAKTSPYIAEQNGYLHSDLKSLHLDTSNQCGNKISSSSGTRTAVQTDF